MDGLFELVIHVFAGIGLFFTISTVWEWFFGKDNALLDEITKTNNRIEVLQHTYDDYYDRGLTEHRLDTEIRYLRDRLRACESTVGDTKFIHYIGETFKITTLAMNVDERGRKTLTLDAVECEEV